MMGSLLSSYYNFLNLANTFTEQQTFDAGIVMASGGSSDIDINDNSILTDTYEIKDAGGDFLNSLLIQRTTANSFGQIVVAPSGTSNQAYVYVVNDSDLTNTACMLMGAEATQTVLNSGKTGSGTALPLKIQIGGSDAIGVETDLDVFIGATKKFFLDGGVNTYFVESADNVIDIVTNGNIVGQFNDTIADTETALLVRKNDGGVLAVSRVTMGIDDSGGAGFRVLRVPN